MSAPDSYFTLSHPARAELREKASRFFGFAERVSDELTASDMRTRLKKEYHDASHQPFALRLATGLERCSDDGEPKGTAGQPILTQIRQADLHNVQIVVVRYFGGTKLGQGGLARAFGECARMALESAGRQQEQVLQYLDLVTVPEQAGVVKAVASRFGASVVATSFDVKARLRLAVPRSVYDECRAALVARFGADILVSPR